MTSASAYLLCHFHVQPVSYLNMSVRSPLLLCFRFSQRTLWLGRFSWSFCLQKQAFSTSIQKNMCRPGPVHLTVSQEKSLIDENLSVSVSGLDPFQEITVMAITVTESKKKYTFGSYGHFKASADGLVDLSRDPSLNGTYTGVEPMGLFWSMIQNPNQRQYARMIKYDSTTAVVYNLSVFSQHVSSEHLWRSDLKPLAHTEIERWYKKPNIKKLSVDKAGIYGSLFIPEERETVPLPAVIDMYGSNGGLIESRAALLASRGFITFSLPYFLYKDLPNTYMDIDFEYFQKAIDWFVNHPAVSAQNGIGVLGSSFGGTLSFYLAAHCPEVKAAISINGPPIFFLSGIKHNGKKVPAMGIECSTFKEDDEGVFTNVWKIDEMKKSFTIPESSLAKFLFLVGDDDKILGPDNYKKWLPHNPISKQSEIELVVYPDTGHLIEPPYTPVFHTCYASLFGCTLRYGGTSAPHAKAQENAWFRIQEFFKKHL